jgi:hypothetical protein
MRGVVRAASRLALMVLVMAVVVVTATAVGLPIAAVLGLSVTAAGLVGMLRLSRRPMPRGSNAQAAIGAMHTGTPLPIVEPTPETLEVDVDPMVASMAPSQDIDPESLMPRWRRPSLLAARREDPTRVARTGRPSLKFPPGADSLATRRIVRYAVVALLDRPDEVLGRQVADLVSGDEVEVLESTGPFWQVVCPDGRQGWVHRTTLGAVGAESLSFGRRVEPSPDTDDLLTAVLSARGIR